VHTQMVFINIFLRVKVSNIERFFGQIIHQYLTFS